MWCRIVKSEEKHACCISDVTFKNHPLRNHLVVLLYFICSYVCLYRITRLCGGGFVCRVVDRNIPVIFQMFSSEIVSHYGITQLPGEEEIEEEVL